MREAEKVSGIDENYCKNLICYKNIFPILSKSVNQIKKSRLIGESFQKRVL